MDKITSKQASVLNPAAPAGAYAARAIAGDAASSSELAKKTGINPVGESSHEIKALHGLRFLAAFCILFSHACAWLGNFRDINTFNRFGEFFTVYGMPLFFVLSGFVIHYNYSRLFSIMRPRWAIMEFLGARFARIYPLFICFFMLGLAVDQVLQWSYHHKLNLLLVLSHELTLTQSWVYIVLFGDRLVLDGTFGLSWSLSTELFFYVSYIVLVVHIVRLRTITGLLVTASTISIVVLAALIYATDHRDAIATFAGRYMNDHFSSWNHSVFRWFFYYSPYVRVFEFIFGCLTAQLYSRIVDKAVSAREARLGSYLLWGSLVVLFAIGLIYLYEPFGTAVAKYIGALKLNFGCAVPLAVLIFCVSRYRSSMVAVVLSTPVMVLLGDLSYSIYTVHTWTLRIFERPQMDYQFGLGLEAAFRITLGIALTIILSTATYRLIEVPARAWLRKAVAHRMLRKYGPKEANRLRPGQSYSARYAIATATGWAAIIGVFLMYQFLTVPHFSPYTR